MFLNVNQRISLCLAYHMFWLPPALSIAPSTSFHRVSSNVMLHRWRTAKGIRVCPFDFHHTCYFSWSGNNSHGRINRKSTVHIYFMFFRHVGYHFNFSSKFQSVVGNHPLQWFAHPTEFLPLTEKLSVKFLTHTASRDVEYARSLDYCRVRPRSWMKPNARHGAFDDFKNSSQIEYGNLAGMARIKGKDMVNPS